MPSQPPSGDAVAARPHRRGARFFVAALLTTQLVVPAAAAAVVWAARRADAADGAATSAEQVVAEVEARALELAGALAALPTDCTLPSPFATGGYLVYQEGRVLCSEAIERTVLRGVVPDRGLQLPDVLRGTALVGEPNGTALMVAVVPAALLTPARPGGSTWALLGAPGPSGARRAKVPTPWVVPPGSVSATRKVADGTVVATAPRPSLLPGAALAGAAAVPLAAAVLLVRRVVDPMAAVARDPFAGVPPGACEEAHRLARRLDAASAERRDLVLAVESVRDEERRRLATEVHDEAVQQLSAAIMVLDLHEEPDPVRDQVVSYLEEAAASLRRISSGLLAGSIMRRGFARALADAVGDLAQGTEVTAHVSVPDPLLVDSKVTGPVAKLLLRNTLEAVRNTLEHAGAAHLEVTAGADGPLAWVEVSDDGRGFTPAAVERAAAEGHIGVASMRTLVESVGGTLGIDSAPGRTVVRIEVPLYTVARPA